MALVLDSTLATAQDSMTRSPLVEILSNQRTPDIPFDGQILRTRAISEREPAVLMHSTGILIEMNVSNSGLTYTYTGTDRTSFNRADITISPGIASGISICELTNGNIGMTYIVSNGTARTLVYRVITPAGVTVSTGTIASWTSTVAETSHTCVVNDAGTYVVIYCNGAYYTAPTTSGAYTGTTNSIYTIRISTAGTQTTAYFVWSKDAGAESSPIQATGSAQVIAEGISITFAAGDYYLDQEFIYSVTPAAAATATIWINSLPNNGDIVHIGGFDYTFRTTPSVAFDVQIAATIADTLENLRLSIMNE